MYIFVYLFLYIHTNLYIIRVPTCRYVDIVYWPTEFFSSVNWASQQDADGQHFCTAKDVKCPFCNGWFWGAKTFKLRAINLNFAYWNEMLNGLKLQRWLHLFSKMMIEKRRPHCLPNDLKDLTALAYLEPDKTATWRSCNLGDAPIPLAFSRDPCEDRWIFV